ncbi:MAG: hypothetical protein NC489_39740 [Ruminococcus flavefaciens]|nr:hypothetical protein [Ruminococcus flavefaciens]
MTYEEWKQLKSIRGEDTKKVIREFELSNPGLAALFEKEQEKEAEQMREAMKITDRRERLEKIAELPHDPVWAARRQREVM